MGKEGLGDMSKYLGSGMGETTPAASSSWGDIFKGLTSIFGQTGANILNAQYGTVPVYTTTNSPYGSSKTVYQTTGQQGAGGSVISPVGTATGSGTILLLAGGLVIVMLAAKN